MQERDYNTLLPDYEEAIAQSMKQPPPPSYQVAMANTVPQSSLQVNLVNPPAALTEVTSEFDTATPPPSFAVAISANSSVNGAGDSDDANTTPAHVSNAVAATSTAVSPNNGQPGSFGSHAPNVKPYYSY